jgi:hypothetical protein
MVGERTKRDIMQPTSNRHNILRTDAPAKIIKYLKWLFEMLETPSMEILSLGGIEDAVCIRQAGRISFACSAGHQILDRGCFNK